MNSIQALSTVTHVSPIDKRFLSRSYESEAGRLDYKVYVPSSYTGAALPLVVMLHGCRQSPEDFAAGTQMNVLAEEFNCIIVYPGQSQAANARKCWNWFKPGDQRRGAGEPALIAGVTRQVMRDYAIDPLRIYVAGLSAGGAAAAIMGKTYPDLYAAVGVHSGLACGAAYNISSAFSAMWYGSMVLSYPESEKDFEIVPTIVFHGDDDNTVSPRNADQVIAGAGGHSIALRVEMKGGEVSDGRSYVRTIHVDTKGAPVLEHWLIHNGGHAWSGGSPLGSYTDPLGPNASREMLRFFFQNPRPKHDAALSSDAKQEQYSLSSERSPW